MSIQTILGIKRELGWGGLQNVNRAPSVQPTRAALVSLLMVFVLLSALLAECLQTSRWGVVNLCDRFIAKKLDFVFTVSVGISEDMLMMCVCV